jgi:SNF2 family DNA or RNA helicase
MPPVLHGVWQPGDADEPGDFCVWAEMPAAGEPAPGARDLGAAPHPFAATAAELSAALYPLAPFLWGRRKPKRGLESLPARPLRLRLPAVRGRPCASPELGVGAGPAGRVRLAPFRVPAVPLTPEEALRVLVALPPQPDGLRLGADLRTWSAAGKLALELLARQHYIPALRESGRALHARWEPVFDDPDVQARLALLARAMPPAARAAAGDDVTPGALLHDFLASVIDECVRGWAAFAPEVDRAASRDPLAAAWLNALWNEAPVRVARQDRARLLEYDRAWRTLLAPAEAGAPFRICFRLEPPAAESGDLRVEGAWRLSYFLQANDDPSLLVPAEQAWRERGGALEFLNRRFAQPQERLLAGLGQAARVCPPVERSLRDARPAGAALSLDEAYQFLSETALLLQASGFGVLVPTVPEKTGLHAHVRLSAGKAPPATGRAGLSLDSLVRFDWQLSLGGEPLARAEFERLAALKVPLVQVRGQWVLLDRERLEAALKFWRAHKQNGEISLREALRLGLATDGEPAETAGVPVAAVEAEGWVADVLRELSSAAERRLQVLEPPAGFAGTLRPYQVVGFSWLAFLRKWGLGACLADDMGLGKGPQTIAFLQYLHGFRGQRGPALVICPTTVVGHWQREVTRFAPDLRVLVHHGIGRGKGERFLDQALTHDLVISSYGLLHRDREHLEGVEWDTVILDEAQAIKNPSTKVAQAARALPARQRIALTGTPVENRLSELWSILEFLNPGYLGSQDSFRHEYATPIERYNQPEPAARLKRLVGPFVLRRVKTDPNVIRDLPDKLEMKVFCNLTREQATLYEAVVRETLKQVDQAEGIQRRGMVLALLTRLKQVCNHPAHYLGDGSELAGRSGKLSRLVEMLEEALAEGDHALIFTQFAEMGELLKAHLAARLQVETLFLHGGVPAKKRDAMVARFQNEPEGPPLFILSLKAGGLGLNLTRANRVFHFDRWWNPAVENQATDRAFRIGQTRNVQVHKFVVAGTLEERIDQLIESKQALAERIVGTGEGWLTEMSTAQLRDLIALRRDAVADE